MGGLVVATAGVKGMAERCEGLLASLYVRMSCKAACLVRVLRRRTWDVPTALEEDYGLSLADRDRLLLQQQQLEQAGPGGAGPPPLVAPRNLVELYRYGPFGYVEGLMIWAAWKKNGLAVATGTQPQLSMTDTC